MLFRQLRSEGSWPFALDVHPRVTVLTGLGRDRQDELARLLEDAVYGRSPRLDGIVDLNGEEVDVATWAGQVGDALERVELIIRPGDLPVPSDADLVDDVARAERGAADARKQLDEATEAVARARSTLARAAARPDTDTGTDGDGHAAASASHPVASAPPSPPPRADEGTSAAVAEAEAKLSQADAALADAVRALAAWDNHRAGAAPYDQDADRVDPGGRVTLEDARRELSRLEARHHEASEQLDAARKPNGGAGPHGADAALVARVREASGAAQTEVEARREDAARLLNEHAVLVERRSQLGPSASPWMVDLAKTSLEDARREFAEAQAMQPSGIELTAEDIADIERLHREATEAAERADRRFSSPVAKRRLAAAMAAEREALTRLGFASYGAYLLRGVGQGDTEPSERLDRARKALTDAEAVWEELQGGGAAGDRGAVRADEHGFLADVAALLGRPEVEGWELSDAASALDALVRDADRIRDERLLALRSVLAEAGVAVGEADPVPLAKAWLDAQPGDGAAGPSVAELERAVADLEREWDAQVDRVDALERDLSRAAVASAQVRDRGQLEAAVRDAEGQVAARAAALEDARARASAAMNPMSPANPLESNGGAPSEDQARRQLEDAEAEMSEAAARYAEANDRVIATRAVRTTVTRTAEPTRVVDAEIYVLARLAAVRSVSSFGSMPLLFIEPFGDLHEADVRRVLDTVSRTSEVIQILIVSDRPDIVAWAEALGGEKAEVCRFASPADPPAA